MAADKSYSNLFSLLLIRRGENSGGPLPSSHLRGHIHNNKKTNVSRALLEILQEDNKLNEKSFEKEFPDMCSQSNAGMAINRQDWNHGGSYWSRYSTDLRMTTLKKKIQDGYSKGNYKWKTKNLYDIFLCAIHWNEKAV